jgi:hypothetical protein
MNTDVIKNAHNDDFVVEQPQFETCVVCNIDTNVPKSIHVDFRHHYVEGAGQLCFDCYTKTLKYIKE